MHHENAYSEMNVYPIFLNDLSGRRCVVVGGDHEAERKAGELVACGAAVEVVAPEVTAAVAAWAAEGRLVWHERDYRPGDLTGAFLAIVSETNPARTAPMWAEAQAEKVLFNAMDDVPHCSFVAGSVVRRGALVFSISTSGCAPALSVRIREHLEEAFGDEYEAFVALMGALRPPMAARYPNFGERRRRWYALVDSDLLALLRAGLHDEAVVRIEVIAGPEVAAAARAVLLAPADHERDHEHETSTNE